MMRLAPVLISLLLPAGAFACKCLATYPVCDAVAVADYVFVGKVESIEPDFPDPWKPAGIPVDEISRLQKDRSPENLAALRNIYLRMFPLLREQNEELDRALRTATSYADLEKAFNAIVSQGKRVHFSVTTVYKTSADDDDHDVSGNDDDRKPEPKTLDVWTDPGDCGFSFQKGETYLVYADDDEETNRLETSSCSRTRRLSDAGADLAYLFFFKGGGASTRLQGFITSDRHQDAAQFPDRIESPVPNLVIELNSHGGSDFTVSDPDGRFVFDGLAEDDYDLSVHSSLYPRELNVLAGPNRLHVKAKSCASTVIVVTPAKPAAH